MIYQGKYSFILPEPGDNRECTFLLRDYYDGSMHGTMLGQTGYVELGRNIEATGNELSFVVGDGVEKVEYHLTLAADGSFTGTATKKHGEETGLQLCISGTKTDIQPEDDRAECNEMKKKALIFYASITNNTKKIADAFREQLEHYGIETTMIKVTNGIDWSKYNGHIFVEDYDIVCLGSPIIGGSPMKSILKHFSAGAASKLEDDVAANASKGLSFNAGGAGRFAKDEVRPEASEGAEPVPEKHEEENHAQFVRPDPDFIDYPGGPRKRYRHRTLGIAFTTYGGGYVGSEEAMPTLELLSFYLSQMGMKVVGRFACCGKEFGPAGLDDGLPPAKIKEPPVYYKDADGKYHAGSYFFHCHMNSKPNDRDITKAKALISDIVEDHFFTSDGIRREPSSVYTTIS